MKNKSFTIIELMIAIAIVGLLAALVLIAIRDVRKRARDSVRLSDMNQIVKALELYYDKHEKYPDNTDYGENDCLNFDVSNITGDEDFGPFLDPLVEEGFFSEVPLDPLNKIGSLCTPGYRYGYHRFTAAEASAYGCDQIKPFYVLAITNMETSSGPHSESPGWSCPGYDWQNDAEWVVGKYED